MFTFRFAAMILLTSAPVYASPLSLEEMQGIKFDASGNSVEQAASFSKWLNLSADDKKASIRTVLDSIRSSTPVSDYATNGINHCVVRQFTSGISLFDLIRGCDDPIFRPMEAMQVCVISKMFPPDPKVSPAEALKDRSFGDKINKSERMVTLFFSESLRDQGKDLQSFLHEALSEASKEITERTVAPDKKSKEQHDFLVKVLETMKECDKIKDDR